jgi:tRNA-binding protein
MKLRHAYLRSMITYADFDNVDIRVGRILTVADFPEARKPAYRLNIDFGAEIGTRRSSAQIVEHYTKEELEGSLILAVVNFPPKQIGPFMSEVLTLGVADENGDVVLIRPAGSVPPGSRMF